MYDLRVREVGNGVERNCSSRINAAEHQRRRGQQHDELVLQRKINVRVGAWFLEMSNV